MFDLNYFKGVDSAFESLLSAMFGPDLIAEFKRKRSAGFIDLMIAFESRKRSANPNKMTSINVALPFSFIDFYRKARGKDVCLLSSISIVMNKTLLADWTGSAQVW